MFTINGAWAGKQEKITWSIEPGKPLGCAWAQRIREIAGKRKSKPNVSFSQTLRHFISPTDWSIMQAIDQFEVMMTIAKGEIIFAPVIQQ